MISETVMLRCIDNCLETSRQVLLQSKVAGSGEGLTTPILGLAQGPAIAQ